MAWGKAGSTTTTSSANSMDSGTMSASETNQILCNVSGLSASTFCETVFNSDTGSNYANRGNQNGGTDFTRTSQSDLNMFESYGNTTGAFLVSYFVNISGEEKLGISQSIREGTSGVGNAPERDEVVYKWTNTSSQITSSTFTPQSGTINTDSNLTVLGSDMTPQINSPAVPAIPSLLPNLPSGSVGGWVELGRTTLGSAGDTITVSSLADKRYYMVLTNGLNTGLISTATRLNADTGSNYAYRRSVNGLGDVTSGNFTRMVTALTSKAVPDFSVQYLSNLSTKEKLSISHAVDGQASGSSSAPNRAECSNKHAQTTNPISEIQAVNIGSGDYVSGSEVVVLGWDPTDTHTTNFWEELASVDLSSGAATNIDTGSFSQKKYLWVQLYTEQTVDSNYNMIFNNDTTTYSYRFSNDGGSDNTSTSQSAIALRSRTANLPQFFNMFIINNSANEKLAIINNVNQNTAGASTAPTRTEQVGKWDNTSSQITSIKVTSGSGNLASKTLMKVWGSD